MATCEGCGDEPGSPYSFLYGISSTRETSANTYLTTQTLTGVATVAIGPSCAGRRRARFVVGLVISLAIVIAAALILFLGVESGDDTMVYGMPIVVVFLVGIAALLSSMVATIAVVVYRDLDAAGHDQAQKVWMKRMKGKGVDFCTTPENWALTKAMADWGGNIPNRKADRRMFNERKAIYLERTSATLARAIADGTADLDALNRLGEPA